MRVSHLARVLRTLVAAWPAFAIGILLLVTTPSAPWHVLGPLTAALVAGLIVRAVRDRVRAEPDATERAGLQLLATTVLRAAVVVSALRLDWGLIARSGSGPWLVALAAVLAGLAAFAVLARWLGQRGPLVTLIAVGSSVCGAAAITAVAPRVDARDEDVTVGIAIVSVLGAAFAVALVLLHAWTGLGGELYALVAGGGLHEVAHVAAAADAIPQLAALALLTKLARVALLPLAITIATRSTTSSDGTTRRRVPGLAIAFFAASFAGSLPGWLFSAEGVAVWHAIRGELLWGANVAFAVAMAAIGLRLSPRVLATLDRGLLRYALLGSLVVMASVVAIAVAVA